MLLASLVEKRTQYLARSLLDMVGCSFVHHIPQTPRPPLASDCQITVVMWFGHLEVGFDKLLSALPGLLIEGIHWSYADRDLR
jgi:hypothetical protein